MGARHTRITKKGLQKELSKRKIWGISIALAYLLILTLTSSIKVGDPSLGLFVQIGTVWNSNNLLYVVLFIALIPVIKYLVFEMRVVNSISVIISIPFALCTLMGRSLDALGNLSFITANLFQGFVAVLCLFGYLALFSIIFGAVFHLFDRWAEKKIPSHVGAQSAGKTYVRTLLIILLCWSPYIILTLPGSTCYDFLLEVRQFIGAVDPTNHHPYLMTLLYGGLYSVGDFFGGGNGGVAFVSLIQTLAEASTLALFLYWFAKMSMPENFRKGLLVFFALCPVFPLYGQICVKDTLSAVFCAIFLLQIVVKLWESRQGEGSKFASWPAIAVICLITCLSRNNCVYIMLPTLICLVFFLPGKQARIGVVASSIAVLLAFCGWTYSLLPLLGVSPGNLREVLSLPVQQTASCLQKYPDDITEEERRAIQTLCNVDVNELGSLYQYKTSDPVKSKFFVDNKEELVNYLVTWAEMGFRHPSLYMRSALTGSYGYWYPFRSVSQYQNQIPITTDLMPEDIKQIFLASDKYELPNTFYDLSNAFPLAKEKLYHALQSVLGLPIVGLLFVPSFYIWVCFLLAFYLISRRNGGGVLLIPVVLTSLVCCVSPLYGSLRYALPFVFMAPLLLACLFACPKRQKHESKCMARIVDGVSH